MYSRLHIQHVYLGKNKPRLMYEHVVATLSSANK